jgi:hypothetical protein
MHAWMLTFFSGKNTDILTIQYIEGKQCEGSIVQKFALRKCDARQEPLPEVLPASFLLVSSNPIGYGLK